MARLARSFGEGITGRTKGRNPSLTARLITSSFRPVLMTSVPSGTLVGSNALIGKVDIGVTQINLQAGV